MDVSAPEFDRDRGQVGIETLVVFIAMILVAAIAATVLINTAGFLQNKASATSQESQSQVSNQVVVISSVGVVGNDTAANSIDNGTNVISNVSLTVMQSPGADAIDLGGSTVKWIGPDGATTLVYNETATSTNAEFSVKPVKDTDSSLPVLNAQTDRMKIFIELARDGATDTPLTRLMAGEEATLQIVTQSGSQYTYIADVPDTLSSKQPGEAVSL